MSTDSERDQVERELVTQVRHFGNTCPRLWNAAVDARLKLRAAEKALEGALVPLAALVVSGECVLAPTALSEEIKLAILKAHDETFAALAEIRRPDGK